MHRFLLSALAGCALATSTIGIASAQSIPGGSYQQSCTNIRVRGSNLIANCATVNGSRVRSEVNLNTCGGDIANANGQLVCANTNNRWNNGRWNNNGRGDNGNHYGWDRGRGNPHRDRGDRDDRDDRDNGGYNNGGYNNGGRYGNWNGGSLPAGSYAQSCTNARVSGGVLSATCTSANGGQINSSINVRSCPNDITNRNGYLSCG